MSDDKNSKKKKYNFGGIKEFNLEEIEAEVLNDSVYLDVFAGSDTRFKTDLRSIDNPLEKLMALDGLSYFYKTEEFAHKGFSDQRQIGFIAQAVQQVLPELVREDSEGYLAVNYAQITPVLVEGVKALNQKLAAQSQEIQELKALVHDMVQMQMKDREDKTDEEKEINSL